MKHAPCTFQCMSKQHSCTKSFERSWLKADFDHEKFRHVTHLTIFN